MVMHPKKYTLTAEYINALLGEMRNHAETVYNMIPWSLVSKSVLFRMMEVMEYTDEHDAERELERQALEPQYEAAMKAAVPTLAKLGRLVTCMTNILYDEGDCFEYLAYRINPYESEHPLYEQTLSVLKNILYEWREFEQYNIHDLSNNLREFERVGCAREVDDGVEFYTDLVSYELDTDGYCVDHFRKFGIITIDDRKAPYARLLGSINRLQALFDELFAAVPMP